MERKRRQLSLSVPPPPPPPPPEDDETGGGWWRASRLIYGGATKLFPSFFSKAKPTTDLNQDDDDADADQGCKIQKTRTTAGGQVPFEAEIAEGGSFMDVCAGSTMKGTSDGSGISEIEQMLKGKALSRDDFNRLTEILQSRIAIQSDIDERGKKNSDVTTAAEAAVPLLGLGNLKCPDGEKKAAHINRVIGDNSNFFPQSTSRELVGASPVDIAKNYMGTRTAESGVVSQNVPLKEETTLPASFLPKLSVPSPTPKTLVCWPGALVQHSHSYATPRTERGRVGLHTSRRTPYSRVRSRSAHKLEGSGDGSHNILSTNVKQLQTPLYEDSQVTRTRISSYNDGLGSVGPIRRVPRKFHGTRASSKGMCTSRASTPGPSWDNSFDASHKSLPMAKQNFGPGASVSSSREFQHVDVEAHDDHDLPTIHSPSSDIARKILEHLDRAVPTPQKTAEELKLATSWRKYPASEPSTSLVNPLFGNASIESSESQWSSHILGQQLFSQEKEVGAILHPIVQPEERKFDEALTIVNTKPLASMDSSHILSERDAVLCNTKLSTELRTPNFEVNRNQVYDDHSQSDKNKHQLCQQGEVGGKTFSGFAYSNDRDAMNVPNKRSTRTFGNKPPLTSICVSKSDPKSNGFSFSFPVCASSAGSVLEPPTPSIMPTFSETGLPRQKETKLGPSNGRPCYSFGSKPSGCMLAFSFPSSSSSSLPCDISTPKFTFGSEKRRISFRSVGGDAVC